MCACTKLSSFLEQVEEEQALLPPMLRTNAALSARSRLFVPLTFNFCLLKFLVRKLYQQQTSFASLPTCFLLGAKRPADTKVEMHHADVAHVRSGDRNREGRIQMGQYMDTIRNNDQHKPPLSLRMKLFFKWIKSESSDCRVYIKHF